MPPLAAWTETSVYTQYFLILWKLDCKKEAFGLGQAQLILKQLNHFKIHKSVVLNYSSSFRNFPIIPKGYLALSKYSVPSTPLPQLWKPLVCFLSSGASDTDGHNNIVHMSYQKVESTCVSIKCDMSMKGVLLGCKDNEALYTSQQNKTPEPELLHL